MPDDVTSNDYFLHITPGKYYECEPFGHIHYLVLDESGEKNLYPALNFESLEVTRDNKLNDLGI
jgi:hypothetical protein